MRKARKVLQGAKYHVIARSNHKDLLLEDSKIKEIFLEIVQRAHEKYDFTIENFVVMGNHIHFILQPLNESKLSEIMKWILGVFAMKYNRIHKLWGHFWGDRFFSSIINSIWEYIRVFEYIDNNPVKANLVVSPHEWKWGGLEHHRHGRLEISGPISEWVKTLFPLHLRVK